MAASRLSARKRARFLDILAETGNVAAAARQAGLSRQYAYVVRREDAAFAAAWEAALDEASDALLAEARRRALEGVEQPVFYRGAQVGTKRVYSDALMMFLLRAHKPELFAPGPGRETGREPLSGPQSDAVAARTANAATDPAVASAGGPVRPERETSVTFRSGTTVDGEAIVHRWLYSGDPRNDQTVIVGSEVLAPPRLKAVWETHVTDLIAARKANREREARLRPHARAP